MRSPIDKKVLLASNSPRRRQLLKEIVNDFEIAPSREVDETYPSTLTAAEVAPYLSRLKADAYADLIDDDTVLITADTVVIVDDKIIGKPRSSEEAVQMLETIAGREHVVITGVTLRSNVKTDTFSCATSVFFDKIGKDELQQYVDEFKPFDKAGSYGIQEWIGCRGINRIDGCFYNVMGLPLNMLYTRLKAF